MSLLGCSSLLDDCIFTRELLFVQIVFMEVFFNFFVIWKKFKGKTRGLLPLVQEGVTACLPRAISFWKGQRIMNSHQQIQLALPRPLTSGGLPLTFSYYSFQKRPGSVTAFLPLAHFSQRARGSLLLSLPGPYSFFATVLSVPSDGVDRESLQPFYLIFLYDLF